MLHHAAIWPTIWAHAKGHHRGLSSSSRATANYGTETRVLLCNISYSLSGVRTSRDVDGTQASVQLRVQVCCQVRWQRLGLLQQHRAHHLHHRDTAKVTAAGCQLSMQGVCRGTAVSDASTEAVQASCS